MGTLHCNTGDHMLGDVDPVVVAFWRRKYREVMSSQISLVDIHTGKPSERFLLATRDEFKGVYERKRNYSGRVFFSVR